MDRSFVFVPVNGDQRKAVALYKTSDILILHGLAGGGKTHTACGLALNDLYALKRRKLILTRPTVECGESLGYLPGNINEKLLPWLGPFNDVMGNMIHKPNELLISDQVEVIPLAYMRGRTISHAVAILDEAQNCTLSQLKMYLSRIGDGGKMIISGDPEQADIKSGFPKIIEHLNNLPGVGIVEMNNQCVRHYLIPEILKRLA